MKNSLNLLFVIALLVVLGCSCPKKLQELSKNSQTSPRSEPSNTSDSDTPGKSDSTDDVSMSKYEAIKTGMRRQQVEEIMGSKGTETFNSEGGGMKFASVKWTGENFKMILVSFQNDKVTSKTQVGLSK